jgi:copper(I)-binding protein
MRAFIPALLAAVLFAAPASAHEAKVGELTVSKLTVKASLDGMANTAGYLTVTNAGDYPDRLVSVSCTCSAKAQIHEMKIAGTMMRMRMAKGGLPVPAHGVLELKPGGDHLMLIGLLAPAVNGTNVQMTLTFKNAGTVTTNFHVKTDPGSVMPAMPGMSH